MNKRYEKELRSRLSRLKRDLNWINRNCCGSPEACKLIYAKLHEDEVSGLSTLIRIGLQEMQVK